MPLAHRFRVVLVVQIALGLTLAYLAMALVQNEIQLNRNRDVRHQAVLLADELRQSSDDLTRMARSYAATGDATYAQQYEAVLGIRNGTRPRPVEYHRIYWDLVWPDRRPPRGDGAPISLQSLMTQLGLTAAERERLTLAQRNSDALAQIEQVAMHAVRGEFADGRGGFTVQRDPDRALATRLLNDDAFRTRKAAIMAPIDEYYVLLERRTSEQVVELEARASRLLLAAGVALAAMLALFMYSFLTLRRQVAARERSERAHQLAAAQMEHAFGASPIGMALVALDGRFLRVNHAFSSMLGRTEGELLALDFQAITHPDDLAADLHLVHEVLEGKRQAYRMEKRYLHKDGGEVLAELHVSLVRGADGAPVHFVSQIQDVTERRRAEQALRESEYFFRESQRVAHIGSYRVDFVSGQWKSSEVLDQIFGIDGEYNRSVAGWLELTHPDDQTMMAQYLQDEVLGNSSPFNKEYRTIRKSDGVVRWVHGLGALTTDADGAIVGMTGTIQDVTERKAAEAEHAALTAQLLQSQKMESVGRLAGGVAHDFNNMLGVILGNVDLALAQVSPTDPLRTDLEEVRSAATRSAELTRQLLAFARKQTLMPQVLDLNATVDGTLKMLQRMIGEDVDLRWNPTPALWPVKMDPAQVDQILANLCVNARDAISDTGHITIETGHRVFTAADCVQRPDFVPGEYVMLAVSDDGEGMDAETKARLFEPFFTTKDIGKGTGLGLAMVYGIIRQSGGLIDVYSEPSHGTSFRIYLPRHRGATSPLERPDDVDAAVQCGTETILIAEDEAGILALTAKILELHGYTVLRAATPGEAMRIAEEHEGTIQLLMTDVVMPGMNGRDLANAMLARHPHLKQLFMSGYTADVIAHRGVLDEGVAFIQKPFSQIALTQKVRAVLDQA